MPQRCRPDWSVLQVYFAITIIISIFGWTELAREVRGRFLALREEDFVTAAALSGASRPRIIFRHMVPSFYSHIIAASTLAIPEMIIAETALSFLGLGLRPPAVSYGVMLQSAQNIQTIATTPWLMVAAIPVDRSGAVVQLPRRRSARCRRPLFAIAARRCRSVPLLSVRDLHTHFVLDEGTVIALDGVSFDVHPGKTLGIVGESGCGKSVTARSILGILDRPGRVVGGEIRFRLGSRENGSGDWVDLAALDPERQGDAGNPRR